MEDVFEDLDDLDCQKSFPNSKKSIFGGRVRESGRFWARKNSKNNPKIVKIHFWKTCSRILQKTGKLDSGSRVYVFLWGRVRGFGWLLVAHKFKNGQKIHFWRTCSKKWKNLVAKNQKSEEVPSAPSPAIISSRRRELFPQVFFLCGIKIWCRDSIIL